MNKKNRNIVEQRLLENRYEYEQILATEGEESANGFRNAKRRITSHTCGVSIEDLKKMEEEMKDVEYLVKIVRK